MWPPVGKAACADDPPPVMPFLLLPIGFSPGHRCRLCNRCLGRAVVCNAVRLAGVGYPGQAPTRGRPGQPRRLFLQLGVCALRRPHKLRVCQDLLFQGRGPCTANLSIGYRPLGPALLVSHDSQKLPLIPASLGPTNLAGQNLAKENRLGAPYFWGHPRFPKGAYKTVHRGLPIGPTEQPKNIGQNLCRLSLCLPPLAHNVLHGVRTRVHIQGYSMTHGTLGCCSDSEIQKFVSGCLAGLAPCSSTAVPSGGSFRAAAGVYSPARQFFGCQNRW